jgi:hypothetical protein
MKNTLHLKNDRYSIEIDARQGTLRSLMDLQRGLELIAEPRLSESFRILLPLPGHECNYILGTGQKLTSIEETENGVKLFWKGPLHNAQGKFDLDVTQRIELVDDEVQFRCEVRNGTKHQIAEVWYAFIAGMDGFGRTREQKLQTEVLVPTGNQAWTRNIFADFGNTRGQTLGCFGAEHSFCYPGFMCMPWISLFNRKLNRAIYFAPHEESPRVKMIRFYLDPGSGDLRPAGNWPRPGETGDLPTGLTMNWVHVPYTKPGEIFTSAPVILRCHDGGWRESGAVYRSWFDRHYRAIAPGSTWIRRETAFVHTMFMLPEDNINLRFKDMPAWARAAKKYGIRHLMLAGWQIGGHDRGYPYYEPDPRLGTYAELKDGIEACHKMGMKVSFFVNCQPIDMTTEWYKKELHKYRILDPHGEQYYIVNYWGMGTLSARSKFLTATPFTEANPAHPEYRRALIRYFKKLMEIGADGLHFDKFFQTPMDFNPRLQNTSPDRAHHEGLLLFMNELFAECRAINPDFCISHEGAWDRMLPYTETCWWGVSDTLKSVFPQRTLILGVEQPYDYNKVNRAVLEGSHILIGAANYNRGMDYAPMKDLFRYIGEVTRIRQELFDIVSLGELLAMSQGIFKVDNPPVRIPREFAAGHGQWSVFRDPHTGRRAIVLANFGDRPLCLNGVRFAERTGCATTLHQPFSKPRAIRFPATLELPAERVAFVVED